MTDLIDEIYREAKAGRRTLYDEEKHCKMLLDIMMNNKKGTMCYFCCEARVDEKTFYNWLKKHELFAHLYSLGQMFARKRWEEEGQDIRDMTLPMGTISYAYEYWKMIGWSRFGVSKTAKVKLELDPASSPDKHYAQLMEQARDGAFTAGELKQLMEAINAGLNAHQVFKLQKEIDELKSDLAIMGVNKNGDNSITNKGIA